MSININDKDKEEEEDEKSLSHNNTFSKDDSLDESDFNNPLFKLMRQNNKDKIKINNLENKNDKEEDKKENLTFKNFMKDSMDSSILMSEMNNNMKSGSKDNPMMMNETGINPLGLDKINKIMNNLMENNIMNQMGNNMMNPIGMNQIGNNMMNQMENNIMNPLRINQMGNNMMNQMGNNMMNQMGNNMMEETGFFRRNSLDGSNNTMNNMMNQRNSINDNEKSALNLTISQFGIITNLDENSIRIKEIIKPYEDKIKELEETIRKNTFQMVLLKEKLNQKDKKNNNNNINQMNLMGMNMMNNNFHLDNDLIEINFQYEMNPFQKVKCLIDELFESVINRYCKKYNKNKNYLKFYFFGVLINTSLTVSELNIFNNSVINVDSNINQMNLGMQNNFNVNHNMINLHNINQITENRINIIFNYKTEKILIFLKVSSTVEDCLKEFLKRVNISENEANNLTFIYNDKKLLLNDKRKLGEIFIGIANINVF